MGLILRGLGDGLFEEGGFFLNYTDHTSLLGVGDFDHDGRTDLAVAERGATSVTTIVRAQSIEGHFAEWKLHRRFELNSQPVAVAVGLFDKDGHQDIMTANRGGRSISLLRGVGNGTFAGQRDIEVAGSPTSVLSADLNNDANSDVVAVDEDGTITSLLGDGSGEFTPVRVETNSQIQDIAGGDFDGDGHFDLVAVGGTASRAKILSGLGDGTFVATGTVGTGRFPSAVAAADLNSDGIMDFVTANTLSRDVTPYLGSRSGAFHPVGAYPIATDESPSVGEIAVADFDGDGSADIVASFGGWKSSTPSGWLGIELTVLLGRPKEVRFDAVTYEIHPGTKRIIISDLNHDGRPDIVVSSNGREDRVRIFTNRGGRHFSQAVYSLPDTQAGLELSAVTDLNGDGHADLIGTLANNAVQVFLGLNAEAFLGLELIE